MTQKKGVGKKAAAPKKDAPKKQIELPQSFAEKKTITWDERNLLIFIKALNDKQRLLLKNQLLGMGQTMILDYKTYPKVMDIEGVEIYPIDYYELGIECNTYLNPTPLTEQDRPDNYLTPNFNS